MSSFVRGVGFVPDSVLEDVSHPLRISSDLRDIYCLSSLSQKNAMGAGSAAGCVPILLSLLIDI